MSEKENKNPPATSTPLSSAGLPASDRSLERVLSGISSTIKSFESVAHMIYTELTSQGQLNMQRHEMAVRLLGKMRLELATLTDQLRTFLQAHEIQLGATLSARDELERTRQKLETAVEDLSGSHELIDPNAETPKAVQKFAVWLANFGWKHKAKVIGWIGIAATSLYHAWDTISPYVHSWFK